MNNRTLMLGANESAYPPCPAALKVLIDQKFELNRYPSPSQKPLIGALSEFYKISQNCLFAGNGSEEAIALVVRSILHPGTNMVISENSFIMTTIHARNMGAEVKQVKERDYRVDVEALAACVTDETRIVYICTPNNPTGTYTTGEELIWLERRLPDTVVLLIDAAYAEFVIAKDYETGLESLFSPEGRVVITRTFSKAYALASQRIGWAAAPEVICQKVNQLRTPFNTNAIALEAATAALTDQDYLQECVDMLVAVRDSFTRALQKIGFIIVPSVTNFILITAHQEDFSLSALHEFLQLNGVITVLVDSARHPAVRISMGQQQEMNQVLKLIQQWLAGQRAA